MVNLAVVLLVILCIAALSGCNYESTYCVSKTPCYQLSQTTCEVAPACVWESDCHHRACAHIGSFDCTSDYGCNWNDETNTCTIIEPGACSGFELGMGGGGCSEVDNCEGPRCEIRDGLPYCSGLDNASCEVADNCELETVERSRFRVGAILPRKWWNF